MKPPFLCRYPKEAAAAPHPYPLLREFAPNFHLGAPAHVWDPPLVPRAYQPGTAALPFPQAEPVAAPVVPVPPRPSLPWLLLLSWVESPFALREGFFFLLPASGKQPVFLQPLSVVSIQG